MPFDPLVALASLHVHFHSPLSITWSSSSTSRGLTGLPFVPPPFAPPPPPPQSVPPAPQPPAPSGPKPSLNSSRAAGNQHHHSSHSRSASQPLERGGGQW
jgi:hypothetical protein